MEFKIFIAEYLLILITMACILFITNEVIKLWDSIHIMLVTRRVRQICGKPNYRPAPGVTTPEPEEHQAKAVWKASPRQDTREWNAPSFNWKYVWYSLGVVGILFLLYVVISIATYDPSGGRG